VCEYTRRRAHQLGIDLVFLPVGSPDLNPIKQVWKSLKWEASPLIVESAAEYRALLTELFEQLTTQWVSEFAINTRLAKDSCLHRGQQWDRDRPEMKNISVSVEIPLQVLWHHCLSLIRFGSANSVLK
jgi:hypothetical protein